MKVRNLPVTDRPREKLAKYGASRLTDAELLAIILGTGRKGQNVISLSRRIMSTINSLKPSDITYTTFPFIVGVGPVKKAQIIALVELGTRLSAKQSIQILSPKDIWNNLQKLHKQKKEHFVVYYLDIKNTVIADEIISVGTLSSSLVHPREVFEPAIRYAAAHVILAHNHPSGDPTPSSDDISITKRLIEAGSLVGIDVLDHVIVSIRGYVSFKESKLL